ncbi:hydroxymethylbilane synthase [Maribacter ulvicola]|uniref:Hydroxymethylbilane synthase n=1 Tax=Maribacter ulvicola TaxID=228959 RepID=A0A1N6PU57_9FLAO|nr:hydroxymethylbilane synthase [Maribacter ulvicola]SIQ07870.1 hydroxymethylbilane synthase [Maribacter ulvicola]
MSKTIRLGTRDSELALWQANTVKSQLQALGYKVKLVPVKSTGDLILNKPLYELGITGAFTKTLDVAMINGDIDIAVHSMKDVPTALPQGIVKAAVIKRGNYMDILAFKDNEEFLGSRDGIIATGSLRRQAQWLNRYPTHKVVDLRGNINKRLEKLHNNDWNGAIFAAAGLERIGLEPDNTIGLTWMLPAPAQGAIMVVAMEKDEEIRKACAHLNHEETDTCVGLEREFLRELEGGCSAPIGALCYINKENIVTLKGVLLNVDGSKKLEAELTAPLGKHQNLGIDCAKSIIARGGKRLMSELANAGLEVNIFSTKKLTPQQQLLLNISVNADSDDFIKINPNRISPIVLKKTHKNVVFTSKNAVEAVLASRTAEELDFENIYCVGRKTRRLIKNAFGKITHYENNAKDLANHIVEFIDGTEITYFHGNLSLDELPSILEENNIEVNAIEAYRTKLSGKAIPATTKGIMFFSPSNVESYLKENATDRVAYCIGETTAKAAREHFKIVKVAKIPTTESVIEMVNDDYPD